MNRPNRPDRVTLWENVTNHVFFRTTRAKRFFGKLLGFKLGKVTERFLLILLKTMKLVFRVDPAFRMHIKDFEAEYVFTDKKARFYVVAVFRNNRLKVR